MTCVKNISKYFKMSIICKISSFQCTNEHSTVILLRGTTYHGITIKAYQNMVLLH